MEKVKPTRPPAERTHNRPQDAPDRLPDAPKGKELFKWLGPAFLWMLSAAGSGELLFTPRIASMYGYSLLWALIAAVVLKWFINREVGRYTVCTGVSILEGYSGIKGPKNWANWLILVPQLVVAVGTLAGIAGAAATAVVLFAPGGLKIWVLVLLAVTAPIIYLGKYQIIDKGASWLAVLISLAVLAAAISVTPAGEKLVGGLVPQVPENVKFDEVLPWLGFALAGASGMIWFSYWVGARSYGASALHPQKPFRVDASNEGDIGKLKGWLKLLTFSNTLAVGGALLIALAFLILGAELLQPKGLVPEENKVSEVLGRLLGDIWGKAGYWFMIGAIIVTFCSTLLSNQDGFARMFADGTHVLLRDKSVGQKWKDRDVLHKRYTLWVLTVLPAAVYLMFGDPVGLLKLAGALTALLIPLVAGLTLYLNHTTLPPALKPSRLTTWLNILAGVFFLVFAVVYLLQIAGVLPEGGA